MRKRIMAISLLLVVVISLSTCEKEPSEQGIVDGVIDSFDTIRTYQFDVDMTMDMASEVEGEVLDSTLMMDSSGTLDLENLQMSVDLNVKMNTEMGLEIYIIDGIVYTFHFDMPESQGEEPGWMKEKVEAEVWEILKGVSGLEDYKELLETAQVKVIGNEKVKGVDCYVVQLTPDMAKLWQIGSEPQGGIGTGGFLAPVPEEFLEEIFRSYSVKQWIAKDTYFLMKAEIDMAMETTPELMSSLGEEGEMSVDITLSFLAYNYNQQVSIVLPPEAEEAIEVPME